MNQYPDAKFLLQEQLAALEWSFQDASTDVGGAQWALKVTSGPPVKIFVALLQSGNAIIVQSRIQVSAEHKAAMKRMTSRERRRLNSRLQLALLSSPNIEFQASGRDDHSLDFIEIRSVLFQDEWDAVAIRRALAGVCNASLKAIVLVQDGAYAPDDPEIQQLSIDPQEAVGSYHSWGANLVVVTADVMKALEKLRRDWGVSDSGKVIERLLADRA